MYASEFCFLGSFSIFRKHKICALFPEQTEKIKIMSLINVSD